MNGDRWPRAGTCGGLFLDDERFDPVLAAAEEVDLPIYVHPELPPAPVSTAYYAGNWPAAAHFLFSGPAFGWHAEAGIHVLRLILSGALDRHPSLKLLSLPDDRHPFRTCFTCGPDRAPGDGLRIFAKRIRGQAVLADRWTPDQSLADNDGSVRPEIVWASLDCPGGWAAFDRISGGVAVLGRMTARVDRTPFVGEPCVIVASSRWRDGRKIDAHSALYSCDGELLAAARAVWIDVTPGGPR